ncbi:MFS general substrate transporter [Thozetella sp. PMI_491]|nr:MFS general substrate transporter [Thozetella sp. PMI_491]
MSTDADAEPASAREPPRALDAAVQTSEETPLLAGAADEPDEDPRALYRQNVIILVFAILFMLELGATTFTPPLNEIIEDVLCRSYHPEAYGSLADQRDEICRSDDVQDSLAMIRGWSAAFDCIPGILTSIPYGILSDSWGRRPILILSLIGINLQVLSGAIVLGFPNIFPVWSILITSFFAVIGGGSGMTVAMLYTFLSDVVPVANRAAVFFQFGAALLIPASIAGPLAAVLMTRSPWLAYFVGAAFILLGNLVAFVLPETNVLHKAARERKAQQNGANGHNNGPAAGEDKRGVVAQTWQHVRASGVEAGEFVMANKRVSILLTTFIFAIVGKWVQEMLLQYATHRYHWSWARATFLLTVGNLSNLAVLLAVLPALNWIMVERLHMRATDKDLLLARASTIALVLGSLVIAFAWNAYILVVGLVVLSCGAGIGSVIRSLANSLVEEHHVGILNTLIGLMTQLALMIGGPLLASALSLGFRKGGLLVGLPFICAAIMFSITLTILLIFRVPPPRTEADEESTEDESLP